MTETLEFRKQKNKVKIIQKTENTILIPSGPRLFGVRSIKNDFKKIMKKNVPWKLLEINAFRVFQGEDDLQPGSLERDYHWARIGQKLSKTGKEASACVGKFLQVV